MLSIIALKRGTGWLTAVEHSAGWENNNIGIYPGYMLDTFCQLGRSKMLGSILGEEELIKPQVLVIGAGGVGRGRSEKEAEMKNKGVYVTIFWPHQHETFYPFYNNSSCHSLATYYLSNTVLGTLLGTSHSILTTKLSQTPQHYSQPDKVIKVV